MRYFLMAPLVCSVASVRLLEESEAEAEASGNSTKDIIVLICVIVGALVGLIALIYYSVVRSKMSATIEKAVLQSGEDKLRIAFEKIEENGSKDFEQMQVIRGKIVEWEEKQRMKQQMIKGRIMQQLTLQSMFEGNQT